MYSYSINVKSSVDLSGREDGERNKLMDGWDISCKIILFRRFFRNHGGGGGG